MVRATRPGEKKPLACDAERPSAPPAEKPWVARITHISVPLAVLLLLWELPQTLVGLLVYLVLRARKGIMEESWAGKRRIVRTRGIGVSLGFTVYWFGEADAEATLHHELGHAVQSAWLGPLYLFAVGLPSILRATWSMAYAARRGTAWPRYYEGYPESWADRLAGVRRCRHSAELRRPPP